MEDHIEKEIMTVYKRIVRNGKFGQYLKADLHVHSPASKCYIKTKKENTDQNEYEMLIERFAESDTTIIAITDHNTIEGYYRIKEIVDKNCELKNKLNCKLILPGVELTCYGKHFTVIFPEDTPKNHLDLFLLDCGIGSVEQGDEDESADRVTPVTLCEKIEEYGGILIIAHCDAENGFLEGYIKNELAKIDIRGQALIKVLKSPAVHGICFNSLSNLQRINEILSSFKVNHLQLLRASDSHSSLENYQGPGRPLGERASWIKLGKLSFKSLRLALKNDITKVMLEVPKKKDDSYIIGVAVKGGFIRHKDSSIPWGIIPLSEELNCVIGARGTGKSTLLDIIRYVFDWKNISLGENIINRFDDALIFLKENGNITAFYMKPSGLHKTNIKKYVLRESTFKKVPNNHRNKLNEPICFSSKHYFASKHIQSYRQRELFNLAIDEAGPTVIVQGLSDLKFGVDFRKVYEILSRCERNIIEHCRDLAKERKFDNNADLTTDYLEENFKEYFKAHKKLLEFHKETIEHLNSILSNKLRLSYELCIPYRIYKDIIEDWIEEQRHSSNFTYEEQLKHKRLLTNLFKNVSENWALPFYIFTHKYKALAESTCIPLDIAKDLCTSYYKKVSPVDVVKLPYYLTEFKLNVNHGISNKQFFVQRSKLSFGQKAVGMLLLILQGATELGEKRPLLIDQPEDDLDNSFVYHSLVREFHSIKPRRQLIIATHNPNIPIGGDSENILVLKSDGEHGWIDCSGTIDNNAVSEKVLQILEGDFDAFARRAEKYGFKLERQNS